MHCYAYIDIRALKITIHNTKHTNNTKLHFRTYVSFSLFSSSISVLAFIKLCVFLWLLWPAFGGPKILVYLYIYIYDLASELDKIELNPTIRFIRFNSFTQSIPWTQFYDGVMHRSCRKALRKALRKACALLIWWLRGDHFHVVAIWCQN